MRLASRPRPTRLPAHPGPDRTDGNVHARLRPTPAAPERPPAWSPSNVHAAVSGAHDGRHDRTGSGQRMPGRVRPDTVPSTGHASRTGSDADRGTDERHGRHSDILDRHDHKAARRDTPSPLLWGRRLRLGNEGRLRDGNTASATVTTAVTRQLLGVAPRSKPRLGALLSSDDFGSSVERAAHGQVLWQVHPRVLWRFECGSGSALSGYGRGLS
jgi:hypothetical protein